MDSEISSWIVLAHLIRPQGRKGELLAELLTDFPDRFVGREDLFLAPPGFGGPQDKKQKNKRKKIKNKNVIKNNHKLKKKNIK